jgi:hypothetical protein
MFACPHCQSQSIAWWRKVLGSPVECPSCHGLSKLSGWATASEALLFPVLGIAVIAAWFMRSRMLVLAVLAVAVLWSSLVAVLVELNPIVEGEIGWTRTKTHWRIAYAVIGLVVVGYLLTSNVRA